MTTTTKTRPGRGWVGFAAILLMVAGTMQLLHGLTAILTQHTVCDTLFWNNNLEAWGWLYLILGIGLLVTGYFIFQRAASAFGVRIFGGCIGAVLKVLLMFT